MILYDSLGGLHVTYIGTVGHDNLQGRASHTEDDGPTLVQKPVVHKEIFHHLCPKNWSF